MSQLSLVKICFGLLGSAVFAATQGPLDPGSLDADDQGVEISDPGEPLDTADYNCEENKLESPIQEKILYPPYLENGLFPGIGFHPYYNPYGYNNLGYMNNRPGEVEDNAEEKIRKVRRSRRAKGKQLKSSENDRPTATTTEKYEGTTEQPEGEKDKNETKTKN